MAKLVTRAVRSDDWAAWLPLWSAYHAFYDRSASIEVTRTTWARLLDPDEPVHAHVAEETGALVGLVHHIFHRNTWMVEPVCYLQDLYASPERRGQGIGRALIEAVYVSAGLAGCSRVYWLTHETNARAMQLYDGVAERSGFLQYRKSIPPRE